VAINSKGGLKMATFPRVSTSAVDLSDLFSEQLDLLNRVRPILAARQEAQQQMDELEKEREALVQRRRRVTKAMDRLMALECRLDADIEAAEELMDELALGSFGARMLAKERAERKARME
jgi:hypothetical protein